MNASVSLPRLLQMLWSHIGKRQRRQLYSLLLLMIIAAIAEMVSIGAIFPFLAVLTAPEKVFKYPLGQWLATELALSTPKRLMFAITVFFTVAIVMAGCIRLLLVWVQSRVAYAVGADLALEVYRRTLQQPYVVHTSRNSSEIINGVYSKASGISTYVILPLATMFSTGVMAVSIVLALVSVDPTVTLAALAGFAAIYGVVAKLTHRRLFRNSRQVADEAGKVLRSLQEGLGGIRDVLLDRSQAVYCDDFRRADLSMRDAQINSAFIAQSPRFAIEALGMLLIAIFAYQLAKTSGGIVAALPVLGALALGAQRMLPLLQQCFHAWSTIRANQASLADTLELLSQPVSENVAQADMKPLPYRSSLQLENLWFRYGPNSDWVLKGVSLSIPKGAKVGVVGVTGCGKSTLLDVSMGLLSPSKGQILVDGMPLREEEIARWQLHITHVPQAVFLADTSIASNIALGVPSEKIDMERVRDAARKAQLLETIELLPTGFDTEVGERGIRLSGGQRQRIGIARALYKRADVLVFDEATSALDNETEKAVMESIGALGPDTTVLIIAHRWNTLSSCDMVVELAKGEINRVGSYQEILVHSQNAQHAK